MQIVIDIPDRIYKIVQKKTLNVIDDEIIEQAIKKGTPLSKGHGDLIDRNELYKDLITNEWITDDDGGGLEDILFDAPTIIGADKG